MTGATYRYVYSGVETVSVYTSTGTWKQDYVYGPGIDEVLMLEQADVLDADGDSNTSETARSWYLKNALGSVMEVLEQDKTEAVSYRYDPYGNITVTRGGSSQSSDPLGQYVTYTGRWRDEETGLHDYRARLYDPGEANFLQRDPLGIAAGPNLYQYCDSDAVNQADPLGLGKLRDAYNAWVDADRENTAAIAQMQSALAKQGAAQKALDAALLEFARRVVGLRNGCPPALYLRRGWKDLWRQLVIPAILAASEAEQAVHGAAAALAQTLANLARATDALARLSSGERGAWSGQRAENFKAGETGHVGN